MWAFWVQLLQFFLENAILKWKLALIQKCIVIFEIVYNEKHGKWYNLLTLLISISQIWTFSCKNLEKIVVYVMPYLKCPPNLKLIIFKLWNCSDSFLLPLRKCNCFSLNLQWPNSETSAAISDFFDIFWAYHFHNPLAIAIGPGKKAWGWTSLVTYAENVIVSHSTFNGQNG